jgi:hypothetical protein
VYFGGSTIKIHPYLPLTLAIPREPGFWSGNNCDIVTYLSLHR